MLGSFLAAALVSGIELDIGQSGVTIADSATPGYWKVSHNSVDTDVAQNEVITITGLSTANVIEITINTITPALKLEFKGLTMSAADKALVTVAHDCAIEIEVTGTNHLTVGSHSVLEFASTGAEVLFKSAQKDTLELVSAAQNALIEGSAIVSFNGVKLVSTNVCITGSVLEIHGCDCSVSTIDDGIGGSLARSILIEGSTVVAETVNGSAIGSMFYAADFTDLLITIKGCTIDASASYNGSAIGTQQRDGMILIEDSTINAKASGMQSAIGSVSTINITRCNVNASAKNGSAIGGGKTSSGFTPLSLTILDSDINTSSEGYSAAIGGGWYYTEVESIRITGCSVHSSAKKYGSAIGGGYGTRIDSIFLESCSLWCSSDEYGAGVGGAYYGSITTLSVKNCTADNIQGGTKAAGLGCGMTNRVTTLTIEDSSLNAWCNGLGAGIGCGNGNNVEDLTIRNSVINASSGENGAGIGGGSGGTVTGQIHLMDSEIYAFAGFNNPKAIAKGAGIGGGPNYLIKNITIERCNVTAISGFTGSGAGIGSGMIENAATSDNVITIIDSNVVAISSLDCRISHVTMGGAGVGSGGTGEYGRAKDLRTIVILGSNVSAFGSNIRSKAGLDWQVGICGAGIGYGGTVEHRENKNNPLDITIKDSRVFAYGGNSTNQEAEAGAAFFGGDPYQDIIFGNLLIENSIVHAVGGRSVVTGETRAAIGYHFFPSSQSGLTGNLIVRNSHLHVSHADDSKSIAISLKTVKYEDKSRVVLHSTQTETSFVSSSTTDTPFIVLTGIQSLGLTWMRVIGINHDFDHEDVVRPTDITIAFSVPASGQYKVHAAKEGTNEKFLLTDNGLEVFEVNSADHNSFENIAVVPLPEVTNTEEPMVSSSDVPIPPTSSTESVVSSVIDMTTERASDSVTDSLSRSVDVSTVDATTVSVPDSTVFAATTPVVVSSVESVVSSVIDTTAERASDSATDSLSHSVDMSTADATTVNVPATSCKESSYVSVGPDSSLTSATHEVLVPSTGTNPTTGPVIAPTSTSHVAPESFQSSSQDVSQPQKDTDSSKMSRTSLVLAIVLPIVAVAVIVAVVLTLVLRRQKRNRILRYADNSDDDDTKSESDQPETAAETDYLH